METTTTRTLVCLLTIASMTACDSDLLFVPPEPDTFVVQAFLFTGEPVQGVTVTGVLPIDADSTAVPEPIVDASITIERAGVEYFLIATPGEPGSYHYPGIDLDVAVGDVFSLEVRRGDVVATAETAVPLPPAGLSLSADSIDAPQLGNGGGRGGGPGGGAAALQARVTASWDNPGSQLHFVVVDNLEADPEILPTTAIFSRFAPRIIQQPTAADSALVPVVTLTHFGQHRLKLYRVNSEYADLYEGLDQDSRDLNEPPSNVHGALGVFSAFSADSTFFRVH